MKKIDSLCWMPIRLNDHFNVDKGIYLQTGSIVEGKIPYITAKAESNGLNAFIGNKVLFDSKSITIEKVKLSAFYQPYKFYCSHDVSVLANERLNKFNSLFICT